MMGAIRVTKRMVQKGPIQYDPNIFKKLIMHGNGWEVEHDESDDIEKSKRREELDADFYKMPKYINPFENTSINPKTFSKTPNKWGGTTITME
jgi:hypothetical protein